MEAGRGEVLRMRSHHPLEQLRSRYAEGRIMGACRYAGRSRVGEVTDRIAKVAVSGFKLADYVSLSDMLRIGHRNWITFVRYHEDTAVGTVFGA